MLTRSKVAVLGSAIVLTMAAAGGSAAVIRSDTASLVRAALAPPAASAAGRGVLADGAASAAAISSGDVAAAAPTGDAQAVVSSLGAGGGHGPRTGSARTRSNGSGAGHALAGRPTAGQTAAHATASGAASAAGSNDGAGGAARDKTAAGGTGAGRADNGSGPGGGAAGPAGQRQPGSASRLAPPSGALAAARRVLTALPHSPRLLTMLAGPGGWPGHPAAVSTAWPRGATATGVEPAVAASLAGLDVAAFQHPVTSQYPKGAPIDWQQVAAAHYRFAAIKGTEGNYYVNPWALTDLAEAKAAGLDVTPYHFAIPNVSSGQQQAAYAVQHAGYAAGPQMLPLTLDIEYDPYVASDGTNECYGLTPAQMTAWIAGFVTTARTLTGQYPIIYTTADWWDTCTGDSTAFAADPMWVAAYETSAPPLPAGWASWTYWQYTSVGTVPGVDDKGSTDLDSFSPTAVALIDPGTLAGRPLAPVSIPVGSLNVGGQSLTWAAAGLPPGIRITADGVLTGVIMNPPVNAKPGELTYQPTVTAQNTAGGTSAVTFTWHVPVACPNHPAVGICPST